MTISDIARKAGVSNAAVSRYFNEGYLSEEKREAIRKVVEETGYAPSLQAQTLRTKRTKTIGIIIPHVNSGAVGKMVDGALRVMENAGYQILIADSRNQESRQLEYLKTFNEKRVDGVIFLGTIYGEEQKKALRKFALPLVILGQKVQGCHCVYCDEFHSIYDTTSLLIRKGRKKLGYISAMMEDEAMGRERYRGYCAAVEDAGLGGCKENYVIAAGGIQGSYEKTGELWERVGDLDGLVCATDTLAVGALRQLKQRGLRIPQDVMLTGHGDNGTSEITTPAITTVRYEYEEQGAFGARMLLELIHNNKTALRKIKLGYTMVERESTWQ